MAVGSAFSVLVALAVAFVLVPRLVFARPACAHGAFDRLLLDAARACALYVLTVLVLTPLRLFQTTGLVLWFVLVAVLARRRRMSSAGFQAGLERLAQVSLYLVEALLPSGGAKVKADLRRWWRLFARPSLLRAVQLDRVGMRLYAVPLVVILLLSLALRIDYPLHHAAFASADSYVHLAWLKYVVKGQLFTDGIYPMGMHGVLAVAGSVVGTTAFELIRFAGAFINTAIVFVVYMIAVRATRNGAAALGTATAAGLVWARGDVGLEDYRFVATLPQEFAILFALVAVYLGLTYAAAPRAGRAIAFGASTVVVAATHPVALGMVALAAAFFGLASRATGGKRAAVRLWVASAGGVVLGHLYLLVGLASGRSIYDPVNPNPVSVGGTAVPDGVVSLVWGNPIRVAAVAGIVVGALAALPSRHRDPRARATLALAAVVGASVAIRTPGDLILGNWYVDRWTDVALAVLPIGLALGLAPVRELWRQRAVVGRIATSTAAGVAVAGALVIAVPPEALLAERGQIEHEEEARVVSEIMRANRRFTYTVVGTPAAYDRVFASGFHVPIQWFANSFTTGHALDPAFALPIATPHVYVIVEKVPFRFRTKTPTRGPTAGYFAPRQRGELMRAVDGWMATYAARHDGVSVWAEDETIRVWRIDHEPDRETAKRFEFVEQFQFGSDGGAA